MEKRIEPTQTGVLVNEMMNEYLVYQPRVFKFRIGSNLDDGGDDITQGPMWVRPMSLMEDMVDNIICVVGHTNVKKIGFVGEPTRLVLTDCLAFINNYLSIIDGELKISVTKIA